MNSAGEAFERAVLKAHAISLGEWADILGVLVALGICLAAVMR